MSTQKTEYDVDLCVIGAGSAGLSMTAGAAMLDRNVLLFEGAEMGGDCLNHGCVPSKAILKAGKMAQAQRSGEKFGITPVEPKVDWEAVKAHIADVIATIAPVDSVERFEGLGATVISEYAKFVDPNTVESETTRVRAKRFVVAVGSRASAPPIPGLDKVDYATNENIFSLETFPSHLLVIGAAQVLVSALSDEGITFYAPAKTKEVRQNKSGVEIELEDGTLIKGSHLLVAAGRAPAVEGLGLEAAGITYDRRGIDTDDNLRTSNKKVYAAGDVAKGMGGLTNIGLTEDQAREQFGDAVQVAEFHFDENDRAIAERSTHGGVRSRETGGFQLVY